MIQSFHILGHSSLGAVFGQLFSRKFFPLFACGQLPAITNATTFALLAKAPLLITGFNNEENRNFPKQFLIHLIAGSAAALASPKLTEYFLKQKITLKTSLHLTAGSFLAHLFPIAIRSLRGGNRIDDELG